MRRTTDERIGGDVGIGFGGVADAFRSNLRDRKEVGAAVAVYQDGHKVVDLWGGSRDPARGLRWEADTLVPVFSTTKGMSAAAMAVAHSRGMFQLDEPVASYWPEFGQNGKAQVTVGQLLAHQAGLAVIDQRLDLKIIADPEALGAVLAAQPPAWPPGTAHGYHAQTLGWYESQLLRRVDPAGRPLGRFFADEVAGPLEAQFFIGLPDDVSMERLAVFSGGGRVAAALHAHQMPKRLLAAMLNPRSPTARAFMNPKELAMNMSSINRQAVLRLEFPGRQDRLCVRDESWRIRAADRSSRDCSPQRGLHERVKPAGLIVRSDRQRCRHRGCPIRRRRGRLESRLRGRCTRRDNARRHRSRHARCGGTRPPFVLDP